MGKHIEFLLIPTAHFAVIDKKTEDYLGSIEWSGRQERHVFNPEEKIVYSAENLGEIIKRLTECDAEGTLVDDVGEMLKKLFQEKE